LKRDFQRSDAGALRRAFMEAMICLLLPGLGRGVHRVRRENLDGLMPGFRWPGREVLVIESLPGGRGRQRLVDFVPGEVATRSLHSGAAD